MTPAELIACLKTMTAQERGEMIRLLWEAMVPLDPQPQIHPGRMPMPTPYQNPPYPAFPQLRCGVITTENRDPTAAPPVVTWAGCNR